MTTARSADPRRAENQRADALRSRALLLRAAADAFTAGDNPTFKDVAKAAGVGIGTLYRHFPTREALVEAVYRTELDRLCDSANDLLNTMSPESALREWMARWRSFVATKRGMSDVLQALAATGTVTRSQTGRRLTAAIGMILDAGGATGSLRQDVRAEDVTAALTGILVVAGSREQEDQATRLLELLLDGLKAPRGPVP
jgi:AcrR family transcriptional regulator